MEKSLKMPKDINIHMFDSISFRYLMRIVISLKDETPVENIKFLNYLIIFLGWNLQVYWMT